MSKNMVFSDDLVVAKVNIKKAIKMQKGDCAHSVPQLWGAFRVFYDELGFSGKKCFIPEGYTIDSWLRALRITYEYKEAATKTLSILDNHNDS